MPNNKMGFEGLIYTGAPGSTGASLLQNTTDMSYNIDPEKGSTTVRGTSTSPPIETEDVTSLKLQVQWTMVNNIIDTLLQDLVTAAATGAARALRTKDYALGRGFDGDVTLSKQHGMNLKGEQTIQFTATPTASYGRAPQSNV